MTACQQTTLDFSGDVLGRQHFIETRRTMSEMCPGTHANVLAAVKAVIELDGTVDANRVRAEMERRGTMPGKERINHIGSTIGGLAGRRILMFTGRRIKSNSPSRKASKINEYAKGPRYEELAVLGD